MTETILSQVVPARDFIDGNSGDDQISGGDGNDILNGEAGNDEIYGGDGNDLGIYNGLGTDAFHFGSGIDTLRVSNITGFSEYRDGDDLFILSSNGTDYARSWGVYQASRLEYIEYTNTPDEEPYSILRLVSDISLVPSSGVHFFAGTSGDDVIDGGTAETIVSVTGYDGNDTITGSPGRDFIDGNSGDDQINGGDGNDILRGSDGDDTINGGGGDDIINDGEERMLLMLVMVLIPTQEILIQHRLLPKMARHGFRISILSMKESSHQPTLALKEMFSRTSKMLSLKVSPMSL